MATDPRLARAVDPRRTPTPLQPPPPPPPTLVEKGQLGGLDGTGDSEEMNSSFKDGGGFKLRFCTVCASNQNRYESLHKTTGNLLSIYSAFLVLKLFWTKPVIDRFLEASMAMTTAVENQEACSYMSTLGGR